MFYNCLHFNIYGQEKWLAFLIQPEISIVFGYFSIHEQLKFHAHLSWSLKKVL